MLARRKPLPFTIATASALLAVGIPFGLWRLEHDARARVAAEQVRTETQRRLAESALARSEFDAARLAAQRGRWQAALQHYAAAGRAGFDPVAIAIGRIEALEGDLQIGAALDEMGHLRQLPLGDRRGRVLLLEADLDVNRLADPDAKLDLVQEALACGGLEPAETELARALLANDLPQAAAHLARARALDPAQRRVNEYSLLVLLWQGNLTEAKSFVATLGALYPEDPLMRVHAGLLAALRGDASSLDPLLDEARAHGARRELRLLQLYRALSRSVAVLHRPWADPVEPDLVTMVMTIMGAAAMLRPSGDEAAREELGRVFRFLPVLIRQLKPVLAALPAAVVSEGGRRALQEATTRALAHMEDPVLYAMRGTASLALGTPAAAEADFTRALDLGHEIVPRTTLLLGLLLAQERQFADIADAVARAPVATRIGGTLTELLILSRTPAEYRALFGLATAYALPETRLRVALSWHHALPADPDALRAVSVSMHVPR